MLRGIYIVIIFIICFFETAIAQKPVPQQKMPLDTLNFNSVPDSISTDTIPFTHERFKNGGIQDSIPVKENIKLADKGLDEEVDYGAKDTMWFDKTNNEMHLYGEAYVNYQEMKLNAGYIVLDIENNIAEARSIPDKTGQASQKPSFNDGTNEVQYNGLRYNFETQKGIVLDAITTEGGMYVHGKRTKYVSAEQDSLIEDDVIYNENALITTCNHEHPHWGFRTKKLKVIPDKIAVVGPANLEIAGIPTPLVLPFGFFPLAEGQSSGFIFPQNYDYSPAKGFGLLDFGWYFPINDYMDLTLTADIYTRGSFGINANSRYKKRYKYNGYANISFDNTRIEDSETGEPLPRRSFAIQLSHNQDSKAHPFRNLSGNISFSTNNHNSFTRNDAGSVLTSSYSSKFYFRHDMPNTPFKFSAGLSHAQNAQTHSMDIDFPDISLTMNTIYPFKRKISNGEDKWYESVNFNYSTKLRNTISATDTTIFEEPLLDNLQSGMEHRATTGLNLKFLKYINFNASANYTERWYLKTRELSYNIDSMEVETNFNTGFDTYRTYNTSAGITWNMFWTQQFKDGWLRGFRHKITPKFSFSYGPDTQERYEEFYLDGDDQLDTVYYNPFQVKPFSSSLGVENMSFNYRFDNNLEFKYFSKKDSTFKKFKIFDTFSFSGNNNFIADSLNWTQPRLDANSRFFKGITTVRVNFVFDPYMEENNSRINKTVWSENKRLLRRESGSIKITNRFSFKKVFDFFKKKVEGKPDETEEDVAPPTLQTEDGSINDITRGSFGNQIPEGRSLEDDKRRLEQQAEKRASLSSLFERLNLVHDFQYDIRQNDGIDTSFVNRHSLSLSGSIPLTENWTIGIGNIGYDLKNGGLNYPQFSFTRKLHCWDMSFSWAPNRDTYSFYIGVSSSSFNFLKYNYGQNNVDGLLGRFP